MLALTTSDGSEARFSLPVGRFAVGSGACALSLTASGMPWIVGTWEHDADGTVWWTPAPDGPREQCEDGHTVDVGGLSICLERTLRGPLARIASPTRGLESWVHVDFNVPYLSERPAPPVRSGMPSKGELAAIACLGLIAAGATWLNHQPGPSVFSSGGDEAGTLAARGEVDVAGADGVAPPENSARAQQVPVPAKGSEGVVPTAVEGAESTTGLGGASTSSAAVPSPASQSVRTPEPRPFRVVRDPTFGGVVVFAYQSEDGELDYEPGTFIVLDDGGSDVDYQTHVRRQMWSHRDAQERCFSALKSEEPGLRGLLWVDFLVGEDGDVIDGSILDEHSTLRDERILDCLLEEVDSLQLPAPPAPPFEFAYSLELAVGSVSVPPFAEPGPTR